MRGVIDFWLKGKREYYTGLAILKSCGANASLIAQLQKGHTPLNKKRLEEAIEQIANPQPKKSIQPKPQAATQTQSTADYSNTELYISCKKEADLVYKQAMNNRAILFNKIKTLQPYEDANAPLLIEERRKPAISIVTDFIKASKLYDRAAYVKQYGRLPHDSSKEPTQLKADGIPNEMVKQKLDNLRKAYNKLKNKPPNPERLNRMAEQEQEIKELEARWQLLKHS